MFSNKPLISGLIHQSLIKKLRGGQPIIIEFYPLELYFLGLSLVSWMTMYPANKAAQFLLKKIKATLLHYFPLAEVQINNLLTLGGDNENQRA